MVQTMFPDYADTDKIYVASFGLDKNSEHAFWGPSRRTEGIVHYVLRGKGYFNGVPVKENQGFYIPPHFLCEYYPDPEDPWGYFWINCSEEMATRYLLPTLRPNADGVFDYSFQSKLLNLCDKIFTGGAGMNSVVALSHAFAVLALHTPMREVSGPEYHVRSAKTFVENNINKRLSVCDVAQAIGIHDRYLYTLFVQYEGISPKEYILSRKVETASDLLANTNLTVMDIAAAVGFPDVYSFSRLFKNKTQVSPLHYRKTVRPH